MYPVSEGYLRKIQVERRGTFPEPPLAVSKTVACKQHCRLEPRNNSVGVFFTIQINPVKFKITADTVVCHFSLLYRWLEEETRVIRNYIRDVINDLKKGFFSQARYLPSTRYVARQMPRYMEFPRTYTPPMGEKREKLRID